MIIKSERWSTSDFEELRGLPWCLEPSSREMLPRQVRVVLPQLPFYEITPEAAAAEEAQRRDKRAPQDFSIRREVELQQHGYTPGCLVCAAAEAGMPPTNHSWACRSRIKQSMAGTDQGTKRLKDHDEVIDQEYGRRI